MECASAASSNSLLVYLLTIIIETICRSIYLDVIVPLARAWSHPHVCDALRPHLAVFDPRVSLIHSLTY
jgi:hypothetical protein